MKHRPRSIAMLGGVAAAILAAALLVGGAQAQYKTGLIRVAPSGTDAPGCGSAAQPCRTAQYGLLQLNPQIAGSWTGEVRLAAGTYTTSADTQIMKITVYPGNLRISGGYSTSNWEVSNPTANPTILDGQGARRGVLVSVSEGVAPGCAVSISNLTIANGRSAADDTYGGGILIDNCKAVSVTNVTIKDSQAVGQANSGASALSPGGGGAIAVRGNATTKAGLALRSVTIQNTQAIGGSESGGPRGGLGTGGGIFAINSTVTGTDVTITSASAKAGDAPGADGSGNPTGQFADALGGGLALIDCPSFSFDGLVVTQSTSTGGDAANHAGYGLGGGVFVERSTGTIASSLIKGNTAKGGDSSGGAAGGSEGGGIFSTDSTLTLSGVEVTNNSASIGGGGSAGQAYGGGIQVAKAGSPTTLTATNTIIAGNRAVSGDFGGGGGLDLRDAGYTLDHVTIADNQLTAGVAHGQAVYFTGAGTTGSLLRSIVSGHGGANALYVEASAGATTVSSVLNNNTSTSFLVNAGTTVNQSGITTGNPRFISPGNPSYNYRIGFSSAAIDAAAGSTLTTDVDGLPRPVGAGADLGASEYQIALFAEVGNGTIALDWTAPAGATVTKYEIQYSKEAGAASAAEGASPINNGTTLSKTLTGLTNGKTYTFTIVAYNGATPVAQSAPFTTVMGRFPAYLPVVVR